MKINKLNKMFFYLESGLWLSVLVYAETVKKTTNKTKNWQWVQINNIALASVFQFWIVLWFYVSYIPFEGWA